MPEADSQRLSGTARTMSDHDCPARRGPRGRIARPPDGTITAGFRSFIIARIRCIFPSRSPKNSNAQGGT